MEFLCFCYSILSCQFNKIEFYSYFTFNEFNCILFFELTNYPINVNIFYILIIFN